MSKSINEKLAEMKNTLGKGAAKPVVGEIAKLPKGQIAKKGRGGWRGGVKPTTQETLIKKGLRAYLDKHINEEVDIEVVGKDGKVIKMKKQRIMYILEKLYKLATKGEGNAAAMNMWLDRALGKAPQPIRGDENDDTPIKLQLDIEKLADKSLYGTSE